MSWSITINNLAEFDHFDYEVIEKMLTQHLSYPSDMNAALKLARSLGMSSVVLSGGRTVSPYNDDEVIVVTMTGMGKAQDFFAAMKEVVVQPNVQAEKSSEDSQPEH